MKIEKKRQHVLFVWNISIRWRHNPDFDEINVNQSQSWWFFTEMMRTNYSWTNHVISSSILFILSRQEHIFINIRLIRWKTMRGASKSCPRLINNLFLYTYISVRKCGKKKHHFPSYHLNLIFIKWECYYTRTKITLKIVPILHKPFNPRPARRTKSWPRKIGVKCRLPN